MENKKGLTRTLKEGMVEYTTDIDFMGLYPRPFGTVQRDHCKACEFTETCGRGEWATVCRWAARRMEECTDERG